MNLTNKQKKVLSFISKFFQEHSYFPTYSEIATTFNVSIATIQEYIKVLQRKGYLEKLSGIARGFVVKNNAVKQFMSSKNNLKLIPILGQVRAGNPNLAYENILGYVPFEYKFVTNNLFALYVKGESMINAGILENDVVIVKSQRKAEVGDIVIALINNEATIKRLKKNKSGYYLKPENSKLSSIQREFTILGKVIGLKRDISNLSILN